MRYRRGLLRIRFCKSRTRQALHEDACGQVRTSEVLAHCLNAWNWGSQTPCCKLWMFCLRHMPYVPI